MSLLTFSGTHATYKARENKFTNWLKCTAEACSKSSFTSKKSTSKHAKILLGNRVRPSELQGLANIVVRALEAEELSYGAIDNLRQTISLRQESSHFFRRQYKQLPADDALKQSNDAHTHHLRVLEGVLKIFDKKLQELATRSTPLPSRPVQQINNEAPNIYDSLKVPQPDLEDTDNLVEEFDALHTSRNPQKARKKKKHTAKPAAKSTIVSSEEVELALQEIEYELLWDEADVHFLIYCFLEDMKKIRDYILERWCDYQEGLVSLTAIALTTNFAFQHFQKAEEQLQKHLPKGTVLENYEDVMLGLFGSVSNKSQFVFGSTANTSPFIFDSSMYNDSSFKFDSTPSTNAFGYTGSSNDNPFEQRYSNHKRNIPIVPISYSDWDHKMYGKAELCCYPVYQQLKSFLKHYPREWCPCLTFSWCRETFDAELYDELRTTFPEKAKVYRNSYLLGSFFNDMGLHTDSRSLSMYEIVDDELYRGFVDARASRVLPIWLVFACQLYVDIHTTMEQLVDCGSAELISVGQRLLYTLDALEESSNVPQGAQATLKMHQTRKEIAEWCEYDFDTPRSDESYVENEHIWAEPFLLLRRQPVFCGLLIFRFSFTMLDIGLKTMNGWGAALAAAHVYNALRNEVPGTPMWYDMEQFIHTHGPDHIFIGGPPNKASEYYKRFELATGASAKLFSPANSHVMNGNFEGTRSRGNVRQMHPETMFSLLFGSKVMNYNNGKTHVELLSDLTAAVDRIFRMNGRAIDPEFGTDLKHVIADNSFCPLEPSGEKYSKSTILTPLQILVSQTPVVYPPSDSICSLC